MGEAEVFFGLGANEAGAGGGDGGVLIELEGELAFFAEDGGDAVRLVVGGVVGLGGGEGFAVADGPDEFASAEMERVASAGAAVGDEDGIALRGGEFAGEREGRVGDVWGVFGVDGGVSKVAILLRKMSIRCTSAHGAHLVGLGGFRSP